MPLLPITFWSKLKNNEGTRCQFFFRLIFVSVFVILKFGTYVSYAILHIYSKFEVNPAMMTRFLKLHAELFY